MSLFSCRNFILTAAISTAVGLGACAAEPAAPATPAAQPTTTQPATQLASAVVVTINGKTHTAAELDKETQSVQMQASRQFPPEALEKLMPQLRQQAMANLISKHLLLQAVADRKITVSDAEIKKAIADVSKNIPAGQTLDEALKHAGIAKDDFLRQMTESLGVEKLVEEETKSAAVGDEELNKFYKENAAQFKRDETVSVRHILVMFAKDDDAAKKAEKKKKADAIRERLLKGEDFAKVCTETTDDPGSKETGGLYKDFGRGKMVPPFENASFTQKVGEIGPIVETEYGYHIIKVEEHKEAGVVPLAEVKDRLKAYLERPKKQEAGQKFVKSLRDAAKITYAEGYAPPPEPAVHPTTAPSTAPAASAPAEPKK